MTRTVTFFITTARSGTQWLTAALREAFGDALVARHEPLGYRYRPKATLRDPDALREMARQPEVAAHFAAIRKVRAERPYVEVGFPAYALAPVLREEFGEALRLVQLTRHPVRVAGSLVSHGWYQRGRRADLAADVAPVPSDPGVTLPEYAARWPEMTAFEKALYYWFQVHDYAREVAASAPPGQFARFAFERLLDDAGTRAAFAAHLGLDDRPGWRERPTARVVDRYPRRTAEAIEPWRVSAHPEIVALAEALGYRLAEVEARELEQRYRKRWPLRAWAALGDAARGWLRPAAPAPRGRGRR
jgi:hypothetical protein